MAGTGIAATIAQSLRDCDHSQLHHSTREHILCKALHALLACCAIRRDIPCIMWGKSIRYWHCDCTQLAQRSVFPAQPPRRPAAKVGTKLPNHPEAGNSSTVIRRHPTRRHRRNRMIRRSLLAVVLAGLTFGFAAVALQHLSPSLFRASKSVEPDRQAAEASRNILLLTQQESLRQIENRPVYPYSVVPGGVRDARELKWAAEHDPVVASHYRGFDYDHARVVRLVLARTAYVSYRIGNKVYWTRHRVTLKKGETVITDGRMTARSRCANRVEEVPQQATSRSEPPVAKFEEPVHPATGTAIENPPVPFQSALLNRPGVPGLGPAPPLSLYDPFGGGTWVPIFPPPLPGVCGPVNVKKKPGAASGTGGAADESSSNSKKKTGGNPCGTGGGGGGSGSVPEPGTWLLVASGFAIMYWRTRHRFART